MTEGREEYCIAISVDQITAGQKSQLRKVRHRAPMSCLSYVKTRDEVKRHCQIRTRLSVRTDPLTDLVR